MAGYLISHFNISERRACRAVNLSRTVFNYTPVKNSFDDKLRSKIIHLATLFGRYGYRKIIELLRHEGITVGESKVRRIWQEEGLKVPQKQPKKGRLWLKNGSCLRLRPEHPKHVWSYDFMSHQTHDGKKFKILNIIDEYTRECLASRIARRMTSIDVLHILADLFLIRGTPKHIRSDNGPEFIAGKLTSWFKTLDIAPLFIHPGSPWENGYCESFNGKMRYELLNGEIFYNLPEARVMIQRWVKQYNTIRPHASLGGRPPAPEAVMPRLEQFAI